MGFVEVIIILAMLLLNGVFAAYELALASMRIPRLRALVEQRRRGARAALIMRERIEASLAVAQLGITLSAAVAGAIGGANAFASFAPMLERGLGVAHGTAQALSLVVIVIPLAAVTILIGELLPKVFAMRNPEWVCLVLSPMMRVFFVASYPIVWLFEYLSKHSMNLLGRLIPAPPPDGQTSLSELRAQVSLLRAAKVIGQQQEQIIVGASRLAQSKLRDIMLPAEEIVMLQVDAPLTENIITAHLDLHTRFPVAEKRGDVQSILGYVNFKEMMFVAKTHPHNPSLREIMRPLPSLPAELAVNDALRQMVGEHVHLALVRNAEGNLVGLVTQEDIFEELVGDIQDEFDRLPRQITPSGRQWVVGGGAPLGRLRQTLGKPGLAPQLGADTPVNDWLVKALGHVPRGGDTLQLDGISVLVRKVRRHKVNEALMDPTGAPLMPGA